MFKSLVTLSLLSVALAQNTSDPALQVAAIKAHFTNAGLVPDLLSTFDPVAAMAVSFDGVGEIQPGQALSKDQVAPWPTVSIAAANSSVDLGSNFTITMVDADAVGADESQGQTRHWLVNGVGLSDASSGNQTVTNSSATAITDYAGPAPPDGSGAHRYVILLYTQPSDFSAPSDLSTPNVGVSTFSLSDYVSSSKLTGPVAGMYFTVEEGTATSSASATSAVETSTLSVASASGSASGSAASGSASSAAMGGFEGAFKVGMGAGVLAAFVLA